MKTKQLILTLTLTLFTVFAFSQSMVGTAHDFSDETWAGGDGDDSFTGRTCVVCHIAHNSAASIDAPLWNRADPATVVQSTYTPYASTTFNAADGSIVGDVGVDAVWTPTGAYADYLYDDLSNDGIGIWTPDGTSVLCLSCHDGVGNLDAFGGTNGGVDAYAIATGTTKMTRAEALRNNGTGEHPYSFTYSAALVTADQGGASNPGLYDFDDVDVAALLSVGKVQCTSCHDVHNSEDTPYGLLVMSNAQSALCRTCHTK